MSVEFSFGDNLCNTAGDGVGPAATISFLAQSGDLPPLRVVDLTLVNGSSQPGTVNVSEGAGRAALSGGGFRGRRRAESSFAGGRAGAFGWRVPPADRGAVPAFSCRASVDRATLLLGTATGPSASSRTWARASPAHRSHPVAAGTTEAVACNGRGVCSSYHGLCACAHPFGAPPDATSVQSVVGNTSQNVTVTWETSCGTELSAVTTCPSASLQATRAVR